MVYSMVLEFRKGFSLHVGEFGIQIAASIGAKLTNRFLSRLMGLTPILVGWSDKSFQIAR